MMYSTKFAIPWWKFAILPRIAYFSDLRFIADDLLARRFIIHRRGFVIHRWINAIHRGFAVQRRRFGSYLGRFTTTHKIFAIHHSNLQCSTDSRYIQVHTENLLYNVENYLKFMARCRKFEINCEICITDLS